MCHQRWALHCCYKTEGFLHLYYVALCCVSAVVMLYFAAVCLRLNEDDYYFLQRVRIA